MKGDPKRSAKLTYAEPQTMPTGTPHAVAAPNAGVSAQPGAGAMPTTVPMSTALPPEVKAQSKFKGNAPMRGTRNAENELPPTAFHTGRGMKK